MCADSSKVSLKTEYVATIRAEPRIMRTRRIERCHEVMNRSHGGTTNFSDDSGASISTACFLLLVVPIPRMSSSNGVVPAEPEAGFRRSLRWFFNEPPRDACPFDLRDSEARAAHCPI